MRASSRRLLEDDGPLATIRADADDSALPRWLRSQFLPGLEAHRPALPLRRQPGLA
jgi:hypothetical protein